MSNRYSERATEPDIDQDVDDESEARHDHQYDDWLFEQFDISD